MRCYSATHLFLLAPRCIHVSLLVHAALRYVYVEDIFLATYWSSTRPSTQISVVPAQQGVAY